jgi:hypothetical protein
VRAGARHAAGGGVTGFLPIAGRITTPESAERTLGAVAPIGADAGRLRERIGAHLPARCGCTPDRGFEATRSGRYGDVVATRQDGRRPPLQISVTVQVEIAVRARRRASSAAGSDHVTPSAALAAGSRSRPRPLPQPGRSAANTPRRKSCSGLVPPGSSRQPTRSSPAWCASWTGRMWRAPSAQAPRAAQADGVQEEQGQQQGPRARRMRRGDGAIGARDGRVERGEQTGLVSGGEEQAAGAVTPCRRWR